MMNMPITQLRRELSAGGDHVATATLPAIQAGLTVRADVRAIIEAADRDPQVEVVWSEARHLLSSNFGVKMTAAAWLLAEYVGQLDDLIAAHQ